MQMHQKIIYADVFIHPLLKYSGLGIVWYNKSQQALAHGCEVDVLNRTDYPCCPPILRQSRESPKSLPHSFLPLVVACTVLTLRPIVKKEESTKPLKMLIGTVPLLRTKSSGKINLRSRSTYKRGSKIRQFIRKVKKPRSESDRRSIKMKNQDLCVGTQHLSPVCLART